MASGINKQTLDDFIKNPNLAMRKGYYPDFMSCLALKASYFDLSDFVFIKTEFIEMFRVELFLFPLVLLCFLLNLIITLTIPLIFPIWALIYWVRIRPKYKKYHEKIRKQNVLYIEDIEYKEQ